MTKTYTDEEIQTAYKELQAEGKIQKVELGLIDDIDKAEDKARSYEKKLEEVIDKAVKEAGVKIDLN